MATRPSHLYRYRAVDDRLRQIVVEHRLYFCGPLSLNDPFEFRFDTSLGAPEEQRERYFRNLLADRKVRGGIVALHMANQDLDALRALGAGDDAYIAYLRNTPMYVSPSLRALAKANLEAAIADQVGVCCFSDVPDNSIMFSRYGADHEGCCLEFSTSDQLLGQAFPIVYSDVPPTLDIFELDPNRFTQIVLGTKHSSWSYEREWRVVVYPMGAGFHPIAPSTLTGVILGYKSSLRTEATIRTLLAERANPGVELSKLFLGSSGYSFQRRALPLAPT